MTEVEYLELERAAETKSEFHDGQMFAMSDGTLKHSPLSTKMSSLPLNQVPAGCRTLNSDMRIKVEAGGLYTYPDRSVICGEPRFFGDRRHLEHYSKQDDGSWVPREYAERDGPVVAGRLGVRIELAELYASALDI